MGALLIFIYKAAVVMLAIFAVYKLLLARTRRPRFCRVALLATYVLAPLAVWLSEIDFAPAGALPVLPAGELDYVDLPAEAAPEPLWPRVLMWVWIGGVAVAGTFTLLSMLRVWQLVSRCRRVRVIGRARLAVTDDSRVPPFSFGRTMVVSGKDLAADGSMIIAHELQHIALGHSLDLVLARFVAVLMWFNPAAWMLVRELSRVHEFEVDGRVISTGIDRRRYQYMLLRHAMGCDRVVMANGLNHSSIRQRIMRMQQPGSQPALRWLAISMLPAAMAATLLTAGQSFLAELAEVGFVRAEAVEVTDVSDVPEESYVGQLDDIVVVGYGAEKKDDTSVHVQDNADIVMVRHAKAPEAAKPAVPVESAVEADAVEPVATVTASGNGNVGYTRGRIRRVRTAGTVSTPFYYIDGDPYERLPADLDQSKIESVTVRRDHPAYPDGVIYITLKHE